MKIRDMRCVPVQAPGRTLVTILVETDEGVTGVGEAGLQRRWKAIAGTLDHFRPWLIGQDCARIEYLWQRMFRGGFYPADKVVGSTIAAIDVALWDIRGQALGVPVFELFGGRCRDYVQCFLPPSYHPQQAVRTLIDDDCKRAMTSGVYDADTAAQVARACVESGHVYFRLGLPKGDGAFESRAAARALVDNLRAVRGAVGDALELMVDLHGELDPSEAVWFCQQVEELGMFCVEDPARSEDPLAYQRIRERTTVPLAAGEQWSSKWEFRRVIEEDLVDFVRIDIAIACGLTEARKIAAMAEAHHIRILPHNPLGPLNTAAALHLDLATPNAGPQEVVFPPHTMLPDVFDCAFRLDGTTLTVPSRPGIGVTFSEAASKDYPAEMTEPPHYHRPDGSFTNY